MAPFASVVLFVSTNSPRSSLFSCCLQIMAKRNPYDIYEPFTGRTPNGWYTPNYGRPSQPPPHYHPPPSYRTPFSYHRPYSHPNEHPSSAALSVNFGPPPPFDPPMEEWQVARKQIMLETARKRRKSSTPERAARAAKNLCRNGCIQERQHRCPSNCS